MGDTQGSSRWHAWLAGHPYLARGWRRRAAAARLARLLLELPPLLLGKRVAAVAPGAQAGQVQVTRCRHAVVQGLQGVVR